MAPLCTKYAYPEAPGENWTPEEIAEWDAIKATLLQGDQDGTGREVIFDIEGDGLLTAQGSIPAATQLWSIGAIDMETKEKFYWGVDNGPDDLAKGARFLSQVRRAYAHNGINFDYPAMEKFLPQDFKRPPQAWDSIVVAKTVFPAETLMEGDMRLYKMGKMPGHLLKRHSLEAWGYRTGTHKVDYKGGFHAWRPAQSSYLMTGDLDGPLALLAKVYRAIGWTDPKPGQLVWPEMTLQVENAVATIIDRQQRYGIRFDVEKAVKLAKHLRNEQARIEKELVKAFGSWWEPQDDIETGHYPAADMDRKLPEHPDVTIPRFGKTGKPLAPYVGPPIEEIRKDAPFVRIVHTTYSPASRDHLGKRLQAVFGWKPKKFGKDGKPTVDETTLEEIPEAVIPAELRRLILDSFVVNKTLGMLAKGQQAWLHKVTDEGRIHGRMDPQGTPTRRATHSSPNLSQTPGILKDKQKNVIKGLAGRYGYDCKELFVADVGWELTDIDASSLELIDLGHYLFPHDGGAFSERVCDPNRDPHQEHADIADMTRADAKTTIYLKVYGGSAYKLSLALSVTPDEIPELLGYKGLPMLLRGLEKRFDADFVAKLDDAQKARIAKARIIIVKLEKGITGLQDLITAVCGAAERGWLKAIDGSRLHVRKPYAALNTLLQSAGAISCKVWMMLLHEKLATAGLVDGVDFKQVLWVHDAFTFTHRPGLGPQLRALAEEAMVEAGVLLNLRGKYRTDGHTGKNWAEVH